MELVAKKRFYYQGKMLEVGESFSASTRDSKILCVCGRASMATVPVPESTQDVSQSEEASDMVQEQAEEGRKKRAYKRRDMVAE